MAEQTLTINTLAATVITPSDVSQFSLDDIAPNIINGGGGTIVDVSGIVTLASQVAELDSDVTVLEANVATVQADVTALQEDVSGLDATVAQVQTTATAAAETANEAKAAVTAASETAQYALKAGSASSATNANRLNYTDYVNHRGYLTVTVASNNSMQFTGTDPMGTSTDLVVDTAIKANTAQYALKSNTAQYALKAGEAATAAYALAVADGSGGSSGGGGFDGSYSGDTLDLMGTNTVKISSTSSVITLDSYAPGVGPTSSVNGVMTAVAYSEMWLLSGGGDDSSGRVVVGARDKDGTLSAMIELSTGSEWSPNNAARVFIGSGMDAMGGNNSYRHGIAVTTNGSESTFQVYTDKIKFGTQDDPAEIYINGTQWDPTSGGSSSGGTVDTAQYALQAGTAAYALAVVGGSSSGGGFDGSYSGSEVRLSASGSTLVLNASSADLAAADSRPLNLSGVEIRLNGHVKTSLGPETFYIGDTSLPDVIKQYAGSGDSSGGGYPPLVQQPTGSNLYYGIVSDNSSLRFGSFGAADGSQAEAVVKVYDDDIYVTSRGGYSNSKQTYGLAVTPPAIRVGTWAGDSPSMYKGMCIPNGVDPAGFMSVGSFIDGTCSYVWGLMADSTTAAFGKVKRSPASGSSINLEEGLQVSEQYVLLANNYNVSGQKSSLEMDADGTTLSAVFTLRSGETTITPSDWAKLKTLADNADALIALLNS